MTSGQFDGWKIVLTDFGMSVIYNQNADAMVLAGARLGGIHTPPPLSDNIQNGGRPVGYASWARTG